MTIKSMTGHGRGSMARHGLRVEVELSTVNRKQLDLRFNLPKEMAYMEPALYEVMQKKLARGRINADFRITWYGAARKSSIQVDDDLARIYVDRLRATARKLELQDNLNASTLLYLPEVVTFAQPPVEPEKIRAVLTGALNKALKQVVAMRKREGEALQQDLEKRLKSLSGLVDRICRRAPSVAKHYRKKLMQRLKDADVSGQAAMDERILKEIALFADRSDIAEETTRLGSHLDQARSVLKSAGPAGRTLDFIAQEMFREINTIGSKANDGDIIRHVVNFKAELERFREQVQNVE